MRGSELFDDPKTPAPAATPARPAASGAPRTPAAPRVATARKSPTRKSPRKPPDGEAVMALFLVLLFMAGSALWASFSASPGAVRTRSVLHRIDTQLVGSWDWANQVRPSYVPVGKRDTVRRQLSRLVVAEQTSGAGYSRAAFGPAWKDIDHNHCPQREDVLRRDLRHAERVGRCTVVAGILTDPYTRDSIQFRAARPNEVQIDHVVSLREAWASGADAWAPEKRVQFANTLADLAATSMHSNESKGDDDASDWTPDSDIGQCWYARRVVSIKTRWGLTADPGEVTHLRRMLGRCPT